MKCDDVDALLDEFVDGTLPDGDRVEVARHLGSCGRCRTAEARTRALLAAARALPRGVEPSRDLWPAIAARIQRARVTHGEFGLARARWRRTVLAAAAAVAAAIALVAVLAVGRHKPGGAPPQAGLATPPGATAASLGLARAQATYEAARVQLLAALEARRGTLSPETLEVVEKNVRIIDRAVEEMQAALARDPGNRDIPGLLVTAYQQEIDLLRRVATLPGRG